MKFALNGALTIGTLDGANVEIRDNVGDENIFIFGHTTPQVQALRSAGYQPRRFLDELPELQAVLEAIRDGIFNPQEPNRYHAVYDMLVNWGDHYLLLADYASYVATQDRVDQAFRHTDAWTRQTIHNVAGMGPFSADRTNAEYAHTIWNSPPVSLPSAASQAPGQP
jgi:starch phosphorylase